MIIFRNEHWANFESLQFELPILQSHRGYRGGGAQENTIEAIEDAFKNEYQMVEVDVRLRHNQDIVVCHDPLSTISQPETLLELNLVLEMLPANRYLNIEIKNESVVNFKLEKRLGAMLKNHPKKNQILISGFNPLSLILMSWIAPSIPRSLSVTQQDHPGNWPILKRLSLLKYVKPHFIDVNVIDIHHYDLIPKERKIVWTVNDAKRASELLLQKKACSILTDTLLPKSFHLNN